jgi:serine/threonine protein kinase
MSDPTVTPSAATADGPELPPRLLKKLRVEVPGYQLLDEIGCGGQATVYRARELTSDLTVAIKILHAGPNADDASRERFRRETTALKALNHPNIVCVIESDQTPAGLDFLVMNYVDGRPLDALWNDRKFAARVAPEPPARLRLFKKICDVVQAAHRAGITHRDLSPSNILLDEQGEPHVLDFGLAATAFDALMSPDGRNVTVTGQFIGKLKYASPEQARGTRGAIDVRTDVYSLGVILYQILTNGAFPYEVVGNVVDVLNNIIHSKPTPPSAQLAAAAGSAPAIPPIKHIRMRTGPPLVNETMEAVVLKALEKDPQLRYESAGAFGEDIERYLAGTPTTAKRRGTERSDAAKPRRPIRLRTALLATSSLLLIIGVIMNARPILNFLGLSVVAASLAAAPATQPAAVPDAPDLTPRQQDLLLQLSDAEANIQAINKALKITGYSVGVAYDRIDSNLKGNELMNRQGGGPVRWDEFYGKTAKDYPSTIFGTMDDHRPRQFQFVYKANNDQIARAKGQIASLVKDQNALLDRRRTHEEDQSRLWATLAWEQVKDREVEFRPLYRFALKPAGPEAAVLGPVILFLRTAASVAHDGLDSIQANQSAAFQSGSQRMDAAYAALQQSLADALAANDLTSTRAKEGQSLKAFCKELSEQAKVIADDYSNALDRDKAKEDNSKLQFRGQLQSSLSSFATQLGKLDDEVGQTALAWGVTADKEKANGDAMPAVAASSVAKTASSSVPAAPANGARVVNLLSLVDVKRDGDMGTWTLAGDVLRCDQSPQSFLEFPYQPPDEYDFRIVFTRSEGKGSVDQICAEQGRQFSWQMGSWNGAACGFGMINGAVAETNPTSRKAKNWIKNNQEYTSVVKVRRTGIEAYLDGKLISSWQTNYSDMSLLPEWKLRRGEVLGLVTKANAVTFRRVEVTELSGPGKTLTNTPAARP